MCIKKCNESNNRNSNSNNMIIWYNDVWLFIFKEKLDGSLFYNILQSVTWKAVINFTISIQI